MPKYLSRNRDGKIEVLVPYNWVKYEADLYKLKLPCNVIFSPDNELKFWKVDGSKVHKGIPGNVLFEAERQNDANVFLSTGDDNYEIMIYLPKGDEGFIL